MEAIGKILSGPIGRHAGSFLAVIGVLWMVGKPHAETFVKLAVDARISAVEQSQKELQATARELQIQSLTAQSDLATIKQFQREQQDLQREQQKLLIDILRNVRQ